jgi:putative selenate reductase
LGPERLRGLLNDTLGFDITVPDEAFGHDPKWDDAMAMVKRLAALAEGLEPSFGLKLTNTLEVINHRPVFPANEKMMYLSGRALHPITLSLAELVMEETDGKVPLSFCGGADARNFPDLIADNLGPVTVCTDLLKPGGYARLQQYLVNLEGAMDEAGADTLDAFIQASSGGHGARFNLARHAVKVLGDDSYVRRIRPLDFKGDRPLGHFDCINAPCVDACPTNQNIPDYLWLVAHGKPQEAMEVILRTNPQPAITGSVCDHPCTERCVRNFYDAPLAIREIKRFAYESAGKRPAEVRGKALGVKVAIVGGGPAGLSAAYFLAKMGFEPEVFEAKQELGGMVGGLIPAYRLPNETLEGDLVRLRELGVPIHLGQVLGRDFTLAALRRDYAYVFLAVGAQKGKRLGIPGEDTPGVMDALDFLDKVRAGTPMDLGRRILVIGAGNSAMDAVRSAIRLVPGGEVTIVYRRTRAQMPADPAEVHDCIEEGIQIRDLVAPASVLSEGGRVAGLACTRMRLGERDASGRPRPVPVEGSEVVLPADTIISAISQEAVLDFLEGLEVQRNSSGYLVVDPMTRETSVPGLFSGGDAVHGASSVILAIADGRAVAEGIATRHGLELKPEPLLQKGQADAALMEKKGRVMGAQKVPVLPLIDRHGFDEVLKPFDAEAAVKEAARCLDCDDLCSLCVTVCPNRANLAYAMAPLDLQLPILVQREGRLREEGLRPFRVTQPVQIVNLGDACNDCGNCTPFCPTSGAPYKDKPRFWVDERAFEESEGDCFRFERQGESLVLEAKLGGLHHRLTRSPEGIEYLSPSLRVELELTSYSLQRFEPRGPLEEGCVLDLQPLGVMLALLPAEKALPV